LGIPKNHLGVLIKKYFPRLPRSELMVLPHEVGFRDRTKHGDKPIRIVKQDNFDPAKYLSHIKDVVKWINKYVIKYGFLECVVEAKDILKTDPLKFDDAIWDFCNGIEEGSIHENQIETSFQIMAELASGNNVTCFGATQCGKTGTSNAVYFIGPLLYKTKGIKTHIVFIAPGQRSIREQADDEFNRFLGLYKHLQFVNHEKPNMTLDFYLRQVVPHFRKKAHKDDTASRLIRTCAEDNKDQIEKIIAQARENKYKVVFLIDEHHWGSGAKSVLDAHIMQLLEKDFVNSKGDYRWVGFSATAWVSTKISSVVMHKLGPGYVGFNRVIIEEGEEAKQLLDDRYDIKPPTIYSFEDLYHESTIPIHVVYGNWYDSSNGLPPKSFEKSLDKNLKRLENDRATDEWFDIFQQWCGRKANSWENYLRFCEQTMVHWINWIFTVNPMKQQFVEMGKQRNEDRSDVGVGLCFRFIRKNDRAAAFCNLLRREIPDIQIMEYHSDQVKMSIKRFMDVEQEEGRFDPTKPFLFIVTGSARMACAFPSKVCYFADFIRKPSNSTMGAILQGLPGRATGWFKTSMIIINQEGKQILTRYERTGKPSIQADRRTVVGSTDKKKRGRPAQFLTVGASVFDLESRKASVGQYHTNAVIKEFIDYLDNSPLAFDENGRRYKPIPFPRGTHIPYKVPNFNRKRFEEDPKFRTLLLDCIQEMGIVEYVQEYHEVLWPNKFAESPILLPFTFEDSVALYNHHNIKDHKSVRKYYGGLKKTDNPAYQENVNPRHEIDRYEWENRLNGLDGLNTGHSGHRRGDYAKGRYGWMIRPQLIFGENLNVEVSDARRLKDNTELHIRLVSFRVVVPSAELAYNPHGYYADVPREGDTDYALAQFRSSYHRLQNKKLNEKIRNDDGFTK